MYKRQVYKQDNETETNSHIRRLTDDERVEEIAHMLSGAKPVSYTHLELLLE